jgi:mRNA interferase MazF
VKTAISLPDATFERATKKSKELGISRSEFFARAAEVYLDELASHSLTRQIDEVAAVITSNTRLATMPGNVFVPAAAAGLPRDSVVNVTALVTLDKTDLGTQAGHLPASLMDDVDRGLRRLLSR